MVRQSKAKTLTTSSRSYGLQGNLELFTNSTNNIIKNPDLMPQPRRPAKKA
jgi:hypothetical protein